MSRKPRASCAWQNQEEWLQPPFPLEEYEGRFRKLRAEMERENVDALLVYDMHAQSRPVRYVANFNSFPGNTLVIIPRDGG